MLAVILTDSSSIKQNSLVAFQNSKYSYCRTKNDIIETVPFLLSFRELVNFLKSNTEKSSLKTFLKKLRLQRRLINFLGKPLKEEFALEQMII